MKTKFRKAGHPKISVVVGISGRTFEFPVERSKSGTTFKFRNTGHPKIEVKPPKSYKNHIKSYKNNIKSYENHIKSYKNHIKSYKNHIKSYKNHIKSYKNYIKSYKNHMNSYKNYIKSYKNHGSYLLYKIETAISPEFLVERSKSGKTLKFKNGTS